MNYLEHYGIKGMKWGKHKKRKWGQDSHNESFDIFRRKLKGEEDYYEAPNGSYLVTGKNRAEDEKTKAFKDSKWSKTHVKSGAIEVKSKSYSSATFAAGKKTVDGLLRKVSSVKTSSFDKSSSVIKIGKGFIKRSFNMKFTSPTKSLSVKIDYTNNKSKLNSNYIKEKIVDHADNHNTSDFLALYASDFVL